MRKVLGLALCAALGGGAWAGGDTQPTKRMRSDGTLEQQALLRAQKIQNAHDRWIKRAPKLFDVDIVQSPTNIQLSAFTLEKEAVESFIGALRCFLTDESLEGLSAFMEGVHELSFSGPSSALDTDAASAPFDGAALIDELEIALRGSTDRQPPTSFSKGAKAWTDLCVKLATLVKEMAPTLGKEDLWNGNSTLLWGHFNDARYEQDIGLNSTIDLLGWGLLDATGRLPCSNTTVPSVQNITQLQATARTLLLSKEAKRAALQLFSLVSDIADLADAVYYQFHYGAPSSEKLEADL